ncbi:hypothetical protein NLU13_0695 [Sarocladium strictum]|uniref:Uncharacterized protein n=1 Tax=Sarocladium strictum TaxID=5046 RepID=A0AA39GRF9_SARSR|nr:hypothetical protein NLU13_0695 [Sarocladium strictum]
MATPSPWDFPWESRDKEVLAKVSYGLPMRRENQVLVDENLRLKRLLRENGISWSPIAQAHLQQTNPAKRKLRASTKARHPVELRVPIEVLLRIVEFALTSPEPIVDPLSPSNPEHLTDAEKSSGNQIAIHLLATCKTLYIEGKRVLWEKNEFTFTTPEAVRNFGELNAEARAKIRHVNFRIIAQYFDDERRKFRHRLDQSYHPNLKGNHALRVTIRPKESHRNRGGFRCYTWTQVADFLLALRAPYDPKFRGKGPRPHLLPSLTSLRLDLVNFTESLLPMPGKDLHDVANHEFARTLNELQLTGVTCDEPGMKATAELVGMVKDNGLYLESVPTYVVLNKRLGFLSERGWCGRIVRPAPFADMSAQKAAEAAGDASGVPKEEGYPVTTKKEDEKIIWKRVPKLRDSYEREWAAFNCHSGYRILDLDSDDETDDDYDYHHICPSCGEAHPGSSFLDEDEDDYFGH